MSLLRPSKPKTARPVRTPRPRVFLSKEENKAVNALRPIERNGCYVLAAYVAVCVTLIQYKLHHFAADQLWKLGVSLALAAALVAAARFSNRLVAGIAALLCVYGPAWGKYVIAAVPLFAVMLFFTFRISGDRKKKIDEHIQSGNYGVDPRSVARQSRKAKGNETATADSTGRSIAAASKRYTPPKAKKK